jgi:hypothetical protein
LIEILQHVAISEGTLGAQHDCREENRRAKNLWNPHESAILTGGAVWRSERRIVRYGNMAKKEKAEKPAEAAVEEAPKKKAKAKAKEAEEPAAAAPPPPPPAPKTPPKPRIPKLAPKNKARLPRKVKKKQQREAARQR